jgi:hypothetical protein
MGMKNSATEEVPVMELPESVTQHRRYAASVFVNRQGVLSSHTQLLANGDVPLFREISRNPKTRDEGIYAPFSGRYFGDGYCGDSSAESAGALGEIP